MAQRYDTTIQLIIKEKGRIVPLNTAEILEPYLVFDEDMFNQFGGKEENRWMCTGYNFWSLFDEEEEHKLGYRAHTKYFYWTRSEGTTVHGTYSWEFPLEALIRVMKAAGYKDANRLNVRASSFRGGVN